MDAHRCLAYVPGEANLWPSLTGAETLHLLGRIQGAADLAYRDEPTIGLDPLMEQVFRHCIHEAPAAQSAWAKAGSPGLVPGIVDVR